MSKVAATPATMAQKAQKAQKAHRDGTSLREAALSLGVTGEDFDRWVDAGAMTRPG